MVELFEGVRDAAYSIINKKGATFYGIAVRAPYHYILKQLNDEKCSSSTSVFQEGQYPGMKLTATSVNQLSLVLAYGIVRPVNIPLNDAEQQKWKLLLRMRSYHRRSFLKKNLLLQLKTNFSF